MLLLLDEEIKQILLSFTYKEQIYFLFLEMKHLESHPMFNPAIKVVDGPQKEKKILPVSADKEDLSFSLFERSEKDPPPVKGSSRK